MYCAVLRLCLSIVLSLMVFKYFYEINLNVTRYRKVIITVPDGDKDDEHHTASLIHLILCVLTSANPQASESKHTQSFKTKINLQVMNGCLTT